MVVVGLNAIKMHEVLLCICYWAYTEIEDKVNKTGPPLSALSVSQMISMVGKKPTLKSSHITRSYKYNCIGCT